MNKNFKAGNQGGFTLIELVVVITILGILAATALPKFVSMSTEARAASVAAVRGSLNSTSAMIHGKAIVAGTTGATGTTTVEGNTTNLVYGYPAADSSLAFAAGLTNASGTATDYNIAYTTTAPATMTVSVLSGGTALSNCNVVYTAAASGGVPSVTATTSGCGG